MTYEESIKALKDLADRAEQTDWRELWDIAGDMAAILPGLTESNWNADRIGGLGDFQQLIDILKTYVHCMDQAADPAGPVSKAIVVGGLRRIADL